MANIETGKKIEQQQKKKNQTLNSSAESLELVQAGGLDESRPEVSGFFSFSGFASLFLLMICREGGGVMSGLERLISAQFVPLVGARVEELGRCHCLNLTDPTVRQRLRCLRFSRSLRRDGSRNERERVRQVSGRLQKSSLCSTGRLLPAAVLFPTPPPVALNHRLRRPSLSFCLSRARAGRCGFDSGRLEEAAAGFCVSVTAALERLASGYYRENVKRLLF